MAKWVLVEHKRQGAYDCWLRPGDKVRLKKTIRVRTSDGKLIGRRYNKGGIWTVLKGSTKPKPKEIFFRTPTGRIHAWDDDKNIYEMFTRPKSLASHAKGGAP